MSFHSNLIFHQFTLSCLLNMLFLMFMVSSVVLANLNIKTDGEALLSFKSSVTFDPSSPIFSWAETSSPCNWTGVVCNNKLGPRVVGLRLSQFGLSGSISPHIGNLSFLRYLELQKNRFIGAIPGEITQLSRLRVLNISFNQIQGVLPSQIFQLRSLETLDLISNRITGKVLDQHSPHPSKLKVLNLQGNDFYGEIPKSLANLSSLSILNLGSNSFSGAIPSELGRLHNLVELDVTSNNLIGPVPPLLYNLSSLSTLAVGNNELTGEIPHDIGYKLPKLLVFIFCFNKFTGKIPGSLHNITNIQIIRISYNFHVGTLPPGLGNLPFLETYNIASNQIRSSGDSGLSFISSLTNSTKLRYLSFGSNLFEGVIPDTIGNLSKVLSKLYMGENHIYGKIPTSIGRLRSLTLLNISSNSLSGEIPPQIAELQELQSLSLGENKLSGVIPNALGNLRKLSGVDLSKNSLVGNIPSSFGGFENLNWMDLSNNKLNGSIPGESLLNLPNLNIFLNLSNNLLSGTLPKEIELLEKVTTIDVSNNLLSGDVPISIINCKSLQELFMANNSFSGPIPSSLGKLKGLEVLDLSSNQLSGSIPAELQDLKALKYLNLSFNNLEGIVPKGNVITLFNSSVHLEGNKNLCLHLACPDNGGTQRKKLKQISIVAIPLIVMLCFVAGLMLLYVRKRKAKARQVCYEPLKEKHQMVSYEELRHTTENFSQENLIGSGSFGSFYKGYLVDHDIAVAIKVLKNSSWKSFVAECEALRNVHHRNLVKLITSCSSINFKNDDFLALVYEYLSNGSLDDWIRAKRSKVDGSTLNIVDRLNVAIDVACALDYLHHDCVVPVVHCDIKPSNILLDGDFVAKVGDFGLARLLLMENKATETSISSTHVLKGSIGYIPPEYGLLERPSTAGDAYSFGVMLFELFTGKSPTNQRFTEDLNLPQWVQSLFPQKLTEIIDTRLLQLAENLYHQGQYISRTLQYDCLTTVIEIGLSCTTNSPNERMNMRNALQNLNSAKHNLLKRPTPGTS